MKKRDDASGRWEIINLAYSSQRVVEFVCVIGYAGILCDA